MTDPIVTALFYLLTGGAIVAAIAIKAIGVIARERDAYQAECWNLRCVCKNQETAIVQLRQRAEMDEFQQWRVLSDVEAA
jgi:hypothetical protein